ncbi:MAG: aspartate aminotransferase family protein [Bacteroidetes bacterium]|nr:MAG: aspartate aminotransferase family protein [Bacteroidota bacterium]
MTHRQLFLRHLAQTSDSPLLLEIEKGAGLYLWDTAGRKYLDLIAGIGVSALGHCHPAVVAAVKSQVEKYMHTLVYGEFVLAPQTRLAELLVKCLPAPLDNVYFVNSGSEAIEGAMKLAKRYTGRPEIISAKNAYHGSTQGAASLMWPTTFTRAFHPLLPGISAIAFNEISDLEKITRRTAAVVIETVQAECGIQPPAKDYLRQLKTRCEEVGALLILDEVQAGFGRTGTLWAFEQYGVVPDILCLAKGMGGGMPIGAFVAPKSIMSALSHDPILGHITTFGGHPVCTAAALATLEVLVREDYIQSVGEKSALFRKLLVHPAIKEVRSAGLWFAVELESFEFLQKVIKRCLANGLITDWFLFNDKSLRIAPPLIIQKSEIEWACSIILEALTYCQNK